MQWFKDNTRNNTCPIMLYQRIRQICFLLIIISLSPDAAIGQDQQISGEVTDAKTSKPLAFVTIIWDESGKGMTTNMEGEFSIPSGGNISTLRFSCVGYLPGSYKIKPQDQGSPLEIKLVPTSYKIDEVKIYPGINPAHGIIQKVYENRELNNPEKMQSFSYTAYNKFYITLDLDSLMDIDSIPIPDFSPPLFPKPDSNFYKIRDLIQKQHLFLLESVSEREYLFPDFNHEKVVASRVSGFKNPTFSIIATQVQSFSFYDDFITIMEKKYLNPVSRGSIYRYLFILEDTLYTESGDTLFSISFRPKKGRVFDGLEGFFHINSNRYAIQNVVARAADPNEMIKIKIQQRYEFIGGEQWFPVQLNTDLIIKGPGSSKEGGSMEILGIGNSYLDSIRLNPALKRRQFQGLEFEIEPGATRKPEEFLALHRNDSLTAKDTETYHMVDSLGRALNLDKRLRTFETFVTGFIPLYIFNIDYTSLLNYNDYEGIRLGLGARTNNRLSRFASLGGYFAYGFKDRTWKYGGLVSLKLSNEPEIRAEFQYNHDVYEPGSYSFLKEQYEFSSEAFRLFLIENMDRYDQKEFSIHYHAHKHLQAKIFLNQRTVMFGRDYLYSLDDSNPQIFLNRYDFTEIGCNIRFAFREKFIKVSDYFVPIGTEFPVFYGNLIKGMSWFDSQLEYIKYEMKVSHLFETKRLGDIHLNLTGGVVKGEPPFSVLYHGHGSYKKFTVETANSFATMRLDEFALDRFLSVFYSQEFGSFLPAAWKFSPELVWVNNIGFGNRSASKKHSNLTGGTMEKGYFESGILINNLVNQWILGAGLGIFYRYGPYAMNKTIDNFAFKFTISMNI